MDEKIAQPTEISLRDYIDLLRRRKAIVIQTFVVVFVIGAIVTYLGKPMYKTSTRIVVEGKTLTVAQFSASDPMSSLFTPDSGHDVATQLEILQGTDMMQKAYQDAGVPIGSCALDVHQVGSTDVIELVVLSSNSNYAYQFAKTLPTTYLKFFTGNRRTELSNALHFAQSRLDEESSKLHRAETELDSIRRNGHIYTLDLERKNRLADKAGADAQVENITATIQSDQVRYDRMVAERKQQPAYLNATIESPNEQYIVLKQKIGELQNQREALLFKFKPTHINIQQIDAQLANYTVRMAKEPETVTKIARNRNPLADQYDADISKLRVTLAANKTLLQQARANATAATLALDKFGTQEPHQQFLESQVIKSRDIVTQLEKDVNDMALREKATHDPVLTISPAAHAIEVSPKSAKNLIYPALVGLILGFCFALLQEFLDDRINSPEDARRLVEAPTLGYVPLIDSPEMRLLSQTHKEGMQSSSFSLLESYRVLRSNVQFASVDNPKNSLLITSTTPGEGKSVTAANLAVALALDGKNVILVDADLRRPTIHDKFKMPSRPGLTNVLVGQATLREALQQTDVPGLQLLVAGPLPPNPAELLNSQAMRQLHIELKDSADVVIYDSPPMLATADAQVLSASVDGVLYVIQFGEAKKSAVRHSMELLGQAHANIMGVIFNKIDLTTRRDDYYYGYYAYYQYYQTTKVEGKSNGKGKPTIQRKRRSTEEFEALRSKSNGNLPPSPFASAIHSRQDDGSFGTDDRKGDDNV